MILPDDIQAYKNIVFAVIAKAMTDSFIVPPKRQEINPEAFSALEFLFSSDVDLWLELVDIDPEAFKYRMKESMWDDSCSVGESQKRAFRENYKRWYKKKNEYKLLGLGYRDE